MSQKFDSIRVKVKKEEKEPLGDEGSRRTSGFFGAKAPQNDKEKRPAKFCGRIIKTCIYLLVFLIPLFFLPFTFEIFEFNKQYLLIGLTGFAFLIWLVKMIVFEKEIKIRKTPLNLPIIIFLGVMILSTIFSVDKISSIFGYYGRFNGSLLEILSLGGLYFLVVNNFSFVRHPEESVSSTKDPDQQRDSSPSAQNDTLRQAQGDNLLNCFLASSFFVVIISFLSVSGILAKILPKSVIASAPILASRTFNAVGGSLEVLSIFLVMVVVLAGGLLIAQSSRLIGGQAKFKIFFQILLLIGGIVLLITINLPRIDFIKQSNNLTIQQLSSLPQEVVLDKKTAFEITKDSIKTNPILGSGPATFGYNFSRFRPEAFNQNQYWALRFDKAGSEIMERIATTGILGFISWLAVAFVFIVALLKSYATQKNKIMIPLFLGWFALFVFQFLYLSNTTLNFCFWMMMALAIQNQK